MTKSLYAVINNDSKEIVSDFMPYIQASEFAQRLNTSCYKAGGSYIQYGTISDEEKQGDNMYQIKAKKGDEKWFFFFVSRPEAQEFSEELLRIDTRIELSISSVKKEFTKHLHEFCLFMESRKKAILEIFDELAYCEFTEEPVYGWEFRKVHYDKDSHILIVEYKSELRKKFRILPPGLKQKERALSFLGLLSFEQQGVYNLLKSYQRRYESLLAQYRSYKELKEKFTP